MDKRGSEGYGDREIRQLELARLFFCTSFQTRQALDHLDRVDRKLLFQELKSHYSLHAAEGNEAEAQLMLSGLMRIGCPIASLNYEFRKLAASDCERRGLGGRALELMARLHEELTKQGAKPAKTAEIAMEYGILHDRHGSKEMALKLFREALDYYQARDDAYNVTAAWFNSASVLYDLDRVEDSLLACRLGLELGGAHFDDLLAHLSLQKANCFERKQEIELACEKYREAALAYERIGNHRQKINILFRIGWLRGRERGSIRGLWFLRKALKLARELDYAAGLALSHLHRAQMSFHLGLPALAFRHVERCLPLAGWARLDRVDKLARGLLYRMPGKNRRPLTFYLKAKAPTIQGVAVESEGQGQYVRRLSDGAATRLWRDSPRSAGQDVTFLVRLLAELGDQSWNSELLDESRVVRQWQRSMREGRRLL